LELLIFVRCSFFFAFLLGGGLLLDFDKVVGLYGKELKGLSSTYACLDVLQSWFCVLDLLHLLLVKHFTETMNDR
jgi:hypothetical protein